MNISLLRAEELSAAQLGAWRDLAQADKSLDSPFYDPAFTLAVAQSRGDVEVAVAHENGCVAAFLPFQRTSRSVAHPVGWKMNDFQGAIARDEFAIDATELLRRCGLSRWHFDHVPAGQSWCSRAQVNFAPSPAIDLSAGYEGYLSQKKITGDLRVKTLQRKSRKLQREVGPLRFEFHTSDTEVFNALLRWKTEQLRQSRSLNIFPQTWARKTVEWLRHCDEPGCQGTLSALYSGDSLVAIHLGLRNSRVLHWWVTAYNVKFERYSPGALLLLRLVEECASRGLERIDLGKGMESYKQQFMTSATELSEGAIALSRWRQARLRVAYQLAQRIRSSSWLSPTAKWMKHMRRSMTRT